MRYSHCLVQLKSIAILSVGNPVGFSGFEGSKIGIWVNDYEKCSKSHENEFLHIYSIAE